MTGYVDAFVGLMYGSEGKGAVCARLADLYNGAVRTGAPNAGHTVIYGGKPYKMRSIPCAWVNPRTRLFVGAGGLINLDVLAKEGVSLPEGVLSRLRIDRNAGIITSEDIHLEESEDMFNKIGSTCEGVGVAQARKIRRKGATLASDVLELAPYITDVAGEMLQMLESGLTLQLEGTQGFGLSLNHGSYPYVTSRDILASSLLSDAGLPPSACREVFGVMRTYPIRVAGNSGPMDGDELTWEEVNRRCGAPEGTIQERTTVTGRIRRVSELDFRMLKRAVKMNGVTGIFITFFDYIDWTMHGKNDFRDITDEGNQFITMVQHELGVPVLAVGTGPNPGDMIWLKAAERIFGEKTLKQLREEVVAA